MHGETIFRNKQSLPTELQNQWPSSKQGCTQFLWKRKHYERSWKRTRKYL